MIEFIERRGQVIDILGEKTAEHHIVAAMESACHAVHAPLVDYFVAPDTEHNPARYLLAVEGMPGSCDNPRDAGDLLRAVETGLRKAAPDYDEERVLGALGPMAMVLLKAGAFERYREQRIAAGVSASQLKMAHVIPEPGFIGRQFQDEVLTRIDA